MGMGMGMENLLYPHFKKQTLVRMRRVRTGEVNQWLETRQISEVGRLLVQRRGWGGWTCGKPKFRLFLSQGAKEQDPPQQPQHGHYRIFHDKDTPRPFPPPTRRPHPVLPSTLSP